MSPSLFLSLVEVEINDEVLLYAYVPPSPQVQSLNGKIFDRNGDADQEITRYADRIAQIAMNKSSQFTERKVFPYVSDSKIKFELTFS